MIQSYCHFICKLYFISLSKNEINPGILKWNFLFQISLDSPPKLLKTSKLNLKFAVLIKFKSEPIVGKFMVSKLNSILINRIYILWKEILCCWNAFRCMRWNQTGFRFLWELLFLFPHFNKESWFSKRNIFQDHPIECYR